MKCGKLYKFLKDSKGAAAIITAFCIVTLIVFSAFVIDFGISYLNTAHMQNSADSSSLAAASLLPVETGDSTGIQAVVQRAYQYLAKNDIAEDEYTIEVQLYTGGSSQYTQVQVTVGLQEDLFIAPVIGIEQIYVEKSATAQVSPTVSTRNLIPLSITKEYLDYAKSTSGTEHLELKFGASSDDVLNGSFGGVDLDGSAGGGTNLYSDWLRNGYSGLISVGQIVPVEAGNMSNPTMAAFLDRYNSCTHGGCTVTDYVDTCPRIVIVPVITYVGSHEVRIDGFSVFVIESCEGQGINSIVKGSFVDDVMVSGEGSLDSTIGSADDFGLHSISLID